MIEPFIDMVTALWFGMLGSCVGSFLNVVAYRLPLEMSVVWKPSHCPRCQHAIRMRDNVPVLGWLLLGGRCRDCGQPIAARYAVVELALGLLFFLLAYVELLRGGANLPGGPLSPFGGAIDNVYYPNWPLLGLFVYHAALLSLLMAILLIDLDGHRVPRRLVIIGLMLGFLPAAVWPWLHPTLALSPLEPGGTTGPFKAGLYLAIGMSVGTLLGAGIGTIPAGLSDSARQPKNLVFAMTVVGLFLGWQAAMTTAAGTVVAMLALRLLSRPWPILRPILRPIPPMVIVLGFTLLQIACWNQMVSLLP
jgi:leader peptidase (prepilin peptidase)/N-methyltransferase